MGADRPSEILNWKSGVVISAVLADAGSMWNEMPSAAPRQASGAKNKRLASRLAKAPHGDLRPARRPALTRLALAHLLLTLAILHVDT
jgi:hypothetical protein